MQKKALFLWVILLSCSLVDVLHAQLLVSPIGHRTAIESTKNARILATGDTLELPFWDDFSWSLLHADSSLWNIENSQNVFINLTMAIKPPSIGVATFDGTNALGLPYSDETTALDNDILESKPINLANLEAADNVYLSFYWQREGYAEKPEPDDSLFVSFLNADEKWIVMYDGDLIGLDSSNYQWYKKSIHIKDPQFLHGGFKFKITGHGNPTGPFDVWHVDYVILDKNRTIANESIKDFTISTQPTSLFKSYSNIPFDQFFTYPDTIFASPSFTLTSLSTDANNPDFNFIVRDFLNGNTLSDEPQNTSQLPLQGVDYQQDYEVSPLTMAHFTPFQNLDSLFLESEITFISNDEPYYRVNDTVRFYTEIHETLSYDDGTAEFAAGVNLTTGEIAVQYSLPSPDTLTHVDIFFPIIYPLPDVATINLLIYKDLSEEAVATLRKQEYSVSYADSLNKFSRYELTTPVVLPAGEFYISMKQYTNSYVPIGLDKNTNNASKFYYKTGGDWIQNSDLNVPGSIMMRAIFADNDHVVMVTEEESEQATFTLYPNPANQQLNIAGEVDQVLIIDLAGKTHIISDKNKIPTGQLPNGIYVVKITSRDQVSTHKLVIRH
ncbi:T9SS type A sorting domain-containing protein [Reichenbachiella agarivorans]|uniref:T9SS type A sorting domain-containing protein n=1 Tax=Reichenbachiella agarivorans TaxID=2979464 RepID=A0ABY6CLS4_9BACT|nr:T9SS type A sorting domain-containing protein [Reichenbachiella agarivorans]UXP31437.1 T9SS type A sorting domain-containing protein [Reichenbachiella agarivorans]